MKKFTKKLIFGILLGLGLFSTTNIKAQLGVTNSNSVQCFTGANQVTCAVSTSIVGTAYYTWSYVNYPCGPAPAISGSGPSVILSLPCAGTYSILCMAMSSSSTSLGGNFTSIYVYAAPTISVTGTSSVCLGNTTTLTAFGAATYTWSNSTIGAINVVSPISNTCYSVIGTNSIGCTGIAVHCLSVSLANISINPPSPTVCAGSSITFTASGAVTYSWNSTPASYSSTLNVIPTLSTGGFTVSGNDANGCFGGNVVFITIDTTCSHVWPGDANSDGVVNTSDVFEIGLAFSNTGAARSPGGNSYTSQFANNWSGTVSTGKNKCHADCNGDGTVNNSDTVAIHTNFLLTHSFKPTESAVNGDISFSANSTIVNEGMWSKVDILLGSSASPVNQIYGVAFDVNFDQSLIETNSAYVVYTSSFLNASNQNVQFRKADFSNGKIYAASVRVNGANVSGSGKIGEFWFKAKIGLPANSILNISASNASRINTSKVNAPLSGGSTSLTVVKNAVGINESNLEHDIQLYPNPASNVITLQSAVNSKVSYIIFDIVGREVSNGEFTHSKTIDLSDYANGSYLVRLESEGTFIFKKLVVEK
jgi:hypothetical protein